MDSTLEVTENNEELQNVNENSGSDARADAIDTKVEGTPDTENQLKSDGTQQADDNQVSGANRA